MNETHFHKNWISTCKKYTPILLITAVLLGCVLLSDSHADAVYSVSGTPDSETVTVKHQTQDFSSRIVRIHCEESEYDTTLPAGTNVRLCFNGTEMTATANDETLTALLARLDIYPGPLDTILVDGSEDPLKVTIAAEPVGLHQVVEAIAYETKRIANPDLPQGEERIAQAGVPGSLTSTYEVTYFNGKELSRQLLDTSTVFATDEIVEYGTAVDTLDKDDRIANVQKNDDGSGVLTFQSGATLKFRDVKGVTATAYTAGRGGAGYITASGTPARVGAVAVDRRVIPLGSKLYIVTNDGKYVYGLAVAEDTGVIGNRVDLYYDDYDECIIFGRRKATVYILED